MSDDLIRWVNQSHRYKALRALQDGPLRRGAYTRRSLGTIYWDLADRLVEKGFASMDAEETLTITDLGRQVLAERGA